MSIAGIGIASLFLYFTTKNKFFLEKHTFVTNFVYTKDEIKKEE